MDKYDKAQRKLLVKAIKNIIEKKTDSEDVDKENSNLMKSEASVSKRSDSEFSSRRNHRKLKLAFSSLY